MKKALIITNLCGFLWKFELDNVELLQQLGYEVHFASNFNEKGYEYEPEQLTQRGVIFHHIDIARSPYMLKMNLKAWKQLRTLIRKEQIDIVHCHTPVGGMLGRLAGFNCRGIDSPKIIYTAHGFHFYHGAPLLNNTFFKFVEYALAPLTDALVVINREDYAQIRKMKLRRKGIRLQIPSVGLNLDRFRMADAEAKRRLREIYQIPQDTFFILSVGELNLNKNQKTMISVMQKIREEYPDKHVLYGLCGYGYWEEDFRNFAKKCGVEDCVKFFGYQEKITDFYTMADATAFPSRREGMGMVGLESLAMGIPVLASDNRGTREYMVNGKNGFVCQWNDVEGFKQAVCRLWKMTEEERTRMRDGCRKSVEKFDRKNTNAIMKDLYREIDRRVAEDGKGARD